MLQSDHVSSLTEDEYLELNIQTSVYVTKWWVLYEWNGKQLKEFLEKNHPFKPSASAMRLIFMAKTIENEDSLEVLLKNKKNSLTIYIIDSSMTFPEQKDKEEKKDEIKENEVPKVRKIKKRISKRKQEKIRAKFLK